MGITINPAGTFLFVANQGNFAQVSSGTVSVYSVNGTTLTEIAGSPFSTAKMGAVLGPGPVAVAVSLSGKYLYVANQFEGTVAAFSINSTSGALTPLPNSPFAAGLNPSGLTITPNGGFLYVANAGSDNVSAFGICDMVTTTCSNTNSPDGSLSPVSGSPFAAGIGPISSATDPIGQYLFVVNRQSSQIAQYKISSGTGALTANSPPMVSTGATPVGIVVRGGTSTIPATGGTFDYVYTTNNDGTSISIFSFDTTTGVLSVVGTPFNTISGFPSAIGAR
jgi:6-phosphogluconolactonase (cycloisomerase 2 family)